MLNYETIAAKCEELAQLSGKPPRYTDILKSFPKGSPNTIHKHFKSWQSKGEANSPTASFTPSDALLDALKSEFGRVAQAAEAKFGERIIALTDELDGMTRAASEFEVSAQEAQETSRAIMEKETASSARAALLEKQLSEAQAQVACLVEKNTTLQLGLQATQKDLDHAQARATTSEDRAIKAEQRAQDLDATLAETRTALAVLKAQQEAAAANKRVRPSRSKSTAQA